MEENNRNKNNISLSYLVFIEGERRKVSMK